MARFSPKKLVIFLVLLSLVGITLGACTTAQPTTQPATTQPAQTTPAQKVYKFSMQSNATPGALHDKQMQGLVGNIKIISGGRLDITHTASGTVVPDLEMIKAVQQGMLDMVYTSSSYVAGTMPLANFQYSYPGQFRNKWDQREALSAGLKQIYRDAYAEQGVYFFDEVTDMEIDVQTVKPFQKLADLRGMKLRVPGGAIADLLKDLAGVSAVVMPLTDIYTSLTTKVIDGYVFGYLYSAEILGTLDIVKYLIDPPLIAGHGGGGMILMKMDTWKSLPSDLQTLLEVVISEFCTNFALPYPPRYEIKAKLVAKGAKAVTLPQEDYDAVAKWSMAAMDKLAAQDPKYTGKAVEFMKKLMTSR